jgi:hypothetical protein
VATEPVVKPLQTEHDDDEALSLVRQDLLNSERFKREYCPTEKVVMRRRAYEGDPEAYDFPYDSDWGARLVNNWMLRQINHKVGKLSKPPIRLNLKHASGDESDATRLMLTAVRRRLEQKGREAKWSTGPAPDAARCRQGRVRGSVHRPRLRPQSVRIAQSPGPP